MSVKSFAKPIDGRIVVMRPRDKRKKARKYLRADGLIETHDQAKWYDFEVRGFRDIFELHKILDGIFYQNAFIVRGVPSCEPDGNPIRCWRWRDEDHDHGLKDEPLYQLHFDVDGLKLPERLDWTKDPEAAIRYVIDGLPEMFHGVTCSWSFSSRHGLKVEGKRWTGEYITNEVRCRLSWVMSRPLESFEVRALIAIAQADEGVTSPDRSVGNFPQKIYVARPEVERGDDPLAKYDVPLNGLLIGNTHSLEVPEGFEREAKWQRAEGIGGQAARHPSVEIAIRSIGLPIHGDKRGEIRSHIKSALALLWREEIEAGREVDADALAERVEAGILENSEHITAQCLRYGRRWDEVEYYFGAKVDEMAQWWADLPVKERVAKGHDGGGGKKPILRVGAPPEPSDIWFVDEHEARELSRRGAEDFARAVELGRDERIVINTPTGANKTGAAVEAAVRVVKRGVLGFLVPNHTLGQEVAERFEQAGLRVVQRLGREQPDPDNKGAKMCLRPEDVKTVLKHGLSVSSTLCRVVVEVEGVKVVKMCPLAGECGYLRQKGDVASAEVVIMSHNALWQGLPEDVPELVGLIVDESAVGSAYFEEVVDLEEADGVYRKKLVKALRRENDGPVRVDALDGLDYEEAMKAERANELKQVVTDLRGDDLAAALAGAVGYRSVQTWRRVWWAVHTRPDVGQSGRLELREGSLIVRGFAGLHSSWSKIPILFLDGTADAEIMSRIYRHEFKFRRMAARNEHVSVRQCVDRSLSYATLANKNNVDKVKARLIEDALTQFGGADVLAIVPLAVEKRWRETGLPSWLSVAHHGAIVGLDKFGDCRAVYVVGRPLPDERSVRLRAAALSGSAVVGTYEPVKRVIATVEGGGVEVTSYEHPNPCAERWRWLICDAAVLQAVGRGRPINRNRAKPLEIVLWNDLCLPELGPVSAEIWEAPGSDFEHLAGGVVLEKQKDQALFLGVSTRWVKETRSAERIDKTRKSLWALVDRLFEKRVCLKRGTVAFNDYIASVPLFSTQQQKARFLAVSYKTAKDTHHGRAVFLHASPKQAHDIITAKLGPLSHFEILALRTKRTIHVQQLLIHVEDLSTVAAPAHALPS